jgi:hypothetical protein
MTIGLPLDIGSALTAGADQALTASAGVSLFLGGQSFDTQPLPNNSYVLFMLSIRDFSPAKQAVQSYIFPISPSAINKEYAAMSNYYDTQGTPQQYGVNRTVDQFGNSPPTFTLEGTTGWQRHSIDGYAFTGMESILQLQNMLNYYVQLNQSQAAANNPNLYSLELYDYSSGDFWQVEPIGRQGITRNERRPLLFNYAFRFVAIKNVAAPIPPLNLDLILTDFQTPSLQALGTLTAYTESLLTNYSPTTGGALLAGF